jgi:uncharacterized protein YkwD
MRYPDPYLRAVVELAAEAARASGRVPPVSEERRNALAADVARLARGERPPPSEVMRFLASHYGLPETDPLCYTLRGPDEVMLERGGRTAASAKKDAPAPAGLRPQALEEFRKAFGRVFKMAPWNRMGVGTHRDGAMLTTVVLMWEQHIELGPVPRRLPSEGGATLRGRFLRPTGGPQVVITMPGGFVRRVPLSVRGETFESEIRCNYGDGRYQVEMVASDATGPLVLANFPVFCGVPAPSDIAAHEDDNPDEIDPQVAEQEILALINQDRRSAGLLPLRWDNRLAAIARAHSRDMAENRFVAHVSPTTGDTLSRARRAGLTFPLILENVGQEGGVRQTHHGFMNSPGHRANVLNARATRVGIGVVVTRRRGDAPVVVTEMFAGD